MAGFGENFQPHARHPQVRRLFSFPAFGRFKPDRSGHDNVLSPCDAVGMAVTNILIVEDDKIQRVLLRRIVDNGKRHIADDELIRPIDAAEMQRIITDLEG